MDLTKYVVELAIAGIGTFAWVILILLTLVDINYTEFYKLFHNSNPFEIIVSFVLLMGPFIYVTGIVNDRLVDNLFDRLFAKKYLDDIFTKEEYRQALALIYLKSERLTNRHNYGRMRIRICRTWCLNGIMILFALNLFLWFRLGQIEALQSVVNLHGKIPLLSLFFSVLFLISSYISFIAWKTLVVKEYETMKSQIDVLSELNKTNEHQ